MNKTQWKIMDQLIIEAAMSPQRFAITSGTSEGLTTGVYEFLQCRRDLTPDECTKCLNSKVQYLLDNYLSNTAGNIRGSNCFTKYHLESIALMESPSGMPSVPILRTRYFLKDFLFRFIR